MAGWTRSVLLVCHCATSCHDHILHPQAPPSPHVEAEQRSFVHKVSECTLTILRYIFSQPLQPSGTPSGLSSARERRRQHRREVGNRGRVVLRSRSSSDQLCNNGNSSSSSSDSTPAQSPKPDRQPAEPDEPHRENMQQEQKEVKDREPRAPVNCIDCKSTGNKQSGRQRNQEVAGDGERDRVASDRGACKLVCVGSSCSSLEDGSAGKSGSGEGGESGEGEQEVEEFYALLDSTLHAKAEGVGSDATLVDCSNVGGRWREGQATLRPGRLQERIAALRRYTYTACWQRLSVVYDTAGSVRLALART